MGGGWRFLIGLALICTVGPLWLGWWWLCAATPKVGPRVAPVSIRSMEWEDLA